MNKRNALLVVLLLLIVGPIVVGLGRTAITLSDEQNRQILNGREVPPDQPIAPITEPVSVVQCADGRTLTMNRSWFRYSDDQYPQRWAAPHMGSGGDRQAEERDRCLGGDNCVIGVHPDGSSDWYCGDPAVLPPNTRVVNAP